MKKRIIALLTAALVIFGCIVQVSAVDSTVAPASQIQPRAFSRDCRQYYLLEATMVVIEDPNWDIYDDTYVTVSFKDTEGPTIFNVIIYYFNEDTNGWIISNSATLYEHDSFSGSIPENAAFKVTAEAIAGTNGNATFQVSLT